MNELNTLTHETPGDLMKNEEKWFKFLSLKNLVAVVVACLPGFAVFSIFRSFGLALVGGIIWILLEVVAYLLTTVVLPPETYAYTGGGQYLYIVLLRKVYRKLTRTTYIKNYKKFTSKKGGY